MPALHCAREARLELVPEPRHDLASVRADLERDGVAVWDFSDEVSNVESFEVFAADVPRRVLGDENCLATLAPTEIRMKISKDGSAQAVTFKDSEKAKTHTKYGTASSSSSKTTNQVLDPLHIDGAKVYGYQMPDFIFLVCQKPCSKGGGANFMVEAEAVLASIRAVPEEAWAAEALFTTHVAQLYYSVTAAGEGRWVGPLATRLPNGRLLLQCPNVFDAAEPRIRPIPESEDSERDQRLIDIFTKHMREAMQKAKRFNINANQVLCVDNLGTSHGRDPYEDLDRTLWRVWTWSSECNGLPEGVSTGSSKQRDCEV